MIKVTNLFLAGALGAGSLLGAMAPASAAHLVGGTLRPGAPARVVQRNYYSTTVYRGYGYRYGYGYPYSYGYPYGGVSVGIGYGGPAYGVGVGVGYGIPAGYGYGYAPYPAVYVRPWHPHRRRVWVAPAPY